MGKKVEEKKVEAKGPLARQQAEFGSKEKLVDRLVTLLSSITKGGEEKDDLKARLLAASNKKLLRLVEVGGTIKEKFGSIEKLAEATATALGRAKDAPYVTKLKSLTPSKLLDLFRSAEKRAKREKAA
jgi:hypothetical protein